MAEDSTTSLRLGVTLKVQRVCKTFDGSVEAVGEVSFAVACGQFVSLLGPSGCGKSTLLRMIAGLERPDTGAILLDGQPLSATPRHAGLAFVFQDAHLLPWRSVLGNVELPLELMGESSSLRREQALRAIADVGLADAADRYPAQLSGGMKMRVSLARALVTRPRLLLLDEPFAALDELTRHHLDEQLLELWSHSGMTILFVTHSISEAAFLSQRSLVFSRRPARLVADIPIDLPIPRHGDLRTDPRFFDAMQAIQKALQENEE